MDDSAPNYYRVLGIGADATTSQVRAAFRELVKTAHPDVGGDAVAFQRIQLAYETLRDPRRRQQYDDDHGIRVPPPVSGGTAATGWHGQRGEFTGDVEFPGWLRDVVDAPWQAESPDDAGSAPPGAAVPAIVRWWWPHPSVVAPAVAGPVVVCGAAGRVVACDRFTGHEMWSAGLGADPSSPAVLAGPTIVVGSSDGEVHGLEPATGVTRWSVAVGEESVHTVEVAPGGRGGATVVVAACGERLVAIDSAVGRPVWAVRAGGRVLSLVLADGLAVVGTAVGSLEAFAVGRGRQRWRHPSVPHPEVPVCAAPPGLWLALRAGRLGCVEPDSGAVLLQCAVGATLSGLSAGVGGPVVTTGGPAAVVHLDRRGGTRWSVPLPAVAAPPIVVEGRVMLVGTDELVRTLDLTTGELLSTASLPLRVRGEAVPVGTDLALRDLEGQVWVVDVGPGGRG
ncbi:MAG: PQQ-binding-like beta-propeller repeat protein [Acidimicrobiia bacterium]|nr:PQQ-binding-like beta-propeller repeat protein [Acidimicrobiia bacterium]